ncbi:MAG: flagellar filament capping protein FliD [Pseudomonadota bacterium]
MSISITTGIASGIDYEAIIDATLAVEQTRIDNLETVKEDYTTSISAYGALQNALLSLADTLSSLTDADEFFEYSATSSDENILSVTVSGEAKTGTYQIEVKEIAKSEILFSHDGFTSADETVGTGTLSIAAGDGNAVDITITEENNTLQGIADAINSSEAGVTADVIQTSEGQYALSLTGDTCGESIAFSVTEDGDDIDTDESGLSRLYTDPETSALLTAQEGSLARISFGGKEIERSTNQIEGLISGVTIDLANAEEGTTVTLKVVKNESDLSDKIQDFVDTYNAVMDGFNLYQDKGDEETIGILFGDSTTNRLRSAFQRYILSQVETEGTDISSLGELGVEMKSDGYLSFSSTKFEAILEADPDGVVTFFTNEDSGFSVRFAEWLKRYADSDGILEGKIEGLQISSDRIDVQIAKQEEKLTSYEERLRTYYTKLETTLSELQNTQTTVEALIESLSSSD